MEKLVNSALELEKAIQECAFAIVKHGDYRKGEELLDAAKLANRLAITLGAIGAKRQTNTQHAKDASQDRPSKQPNKSGYPKFNIEGDALVKVGKGRNKKSREYRHLVPIRHLNHILTGIVAMTMSTEEFTLPALIEKIGNGLPAYQVYVTVEALKNSGSLNQITRGLYSARAGHKIPSGVDDLRLLLNQTEREAEAN